MGGGVRGRYEGGSRVEGVYEVEVCGGGVGRAGSSSMSLLIQVTWNYRIC